jgi:hypothetical protein
LHVLGLPPAFALSQDQTLKLDEILFRLITTFDEVPPKLSRAFVRPDEFDRRNVRRLREIYGVDLKRVPPKSRPAAPHGGTSTQGKRIPPTQATRKDSAVHVSLPSDSPVKQPGANSPLPGHAREPAKQP